MPDSLVLSGGHPFAPTIFPIKPKKIWEFMPNKCLQNIPEYAILG